MNKICDHTNTPVENIAHWSHVPLASGHHTAFYLLRCSCGAVIGFPQENFDLALKEGTEAVKEELYKLAHGEVMNEA